MYIFFTCCPTHWRNREHNKGRVEQHPLSSPQVCPILLGKFQMLEKKTNYKDQKCADDKKTCSAQVTANGNIEQQKHAVAN